MRSGDGDADDEAECGKQDGLAKHQIDARERGCCILRLESGESSCYGVCAYMGRETRRKAERGVYGGRCRLSSGGSTGSNAHAAAAASLSCAIGGFPRVKWYGAGDGGRAFLRGFMPGWHWSIKAGVLD